MVPQDNFGWESPADESTGEARAQEGDANLEEQDMEGTVDKMNSLFGDSPNRVC